MNSNFTSFWHKSKQLCDFLQYPQNLSVKVYRQQLLILLLNVYTGGVQLQHNNEAGDDELIDDELTDQVEHLELAFEDEIGDVNYYVDSYNPYEFKENPLVTASLIDELNEIFRQLKVQLLKLETNDDKWIADAEWTIQFHLNLSLLNELIDVSRALHYALEIDE